MSPESFCYWLQGFFELSGSKELTPQQVAMIQEHLALVFNKVTTTKISEPTTKPLDSSEFQKILDEIRKGTPVTNPPPLGPQYPWVGPTYPTEPWWKPTVYCSANTELPPSGLKVECMDTSKTSDADLDCTSVCNNAGTGETNGLNHGHPIFIC